MSKKKKKTDKSEKKARVHKELEGFEIKINPLGEITSSYSIDQLNEFLDKNVHDKKLTDKGPGKMKEDDDDFHIEESQEEEENPEDFIPKAKRAKGGQEENEEDEEDEKDEGETLPIK
ncbi:hypothetical protein [Adhaeribacter soli]|uniref:Uncharacterized protein n=1 Tax=Adhaeribacter soli TaxID=2607655 RepID=A0A5N1IPM3_9BACT|nr:hypothetical protein [Adhaeribacter soli]KAA9331718.1 hypothetical protein F0P94_12970 [Adhaeribacter soli]